MQSRLLILRCLADITANDPATTHTASLRNCLLTDSSPSLQVAFIEGLDGGQGHEQDSLTTVDGGQTFNKLTTSYSILGVKYHPRNAKWAMGHTGRHCVLAPCMGKSGGLVVSSPTCCFNEPVAIYEDHVYCG